MKFSHQYLIEALLALTTLASPAQTPINQFPGSGEPKDLFAPDPRFAEVSSECRKAKEFLQQRRIKASELTCAEAIKQAGDIAAREFARNQHLKGDAAMEKARDAGDLLLDILKQLKKAEPDPVGVGLDEFFKDVNKIPETEDQGPFPPTVPKQPIPWPDTSAPTLLIWTNAGPEFRVPSPLQH